MPPPVSALSIVGATVRDVVKTELNATSNGFSVTLGAPASQPAVAEENRLNLFFYRFAPSGFESAIDPGEPFRIRTYCLITAFGIDEDDITAGETDLRLLGAVMRLFHEQPILGPFDVDGQTVRLEVIWLPLSDDQLNQIWSTQGDATYRPSLIYEFSLVPIVPTELRTQAPLVGGFGFQAHANVGARNRAFSGTIETALVPRHGFDPDNPLWLPSLCFVHASRCVTALSFDVDSPAFAAFDPAVWVAGDPNEVLQLIWEIWRGERWEANGPAVAATPFTTHIDPDQIPPPVANVFPFTLTLPVALGPSDTAAQAMLTATRVYTPSGGQPVSLRSNPLLVSVYRSSP